MAETDKTHNQFLQRQFAPGSRQTPDLIDQFLEKMGYYRKHTSTDSTCLFRVVSELQHGVQTYHENVRRNCIQYMRENEHLFAKTIKWNFASYLANMAQTRTYGSKLELKALAMFYGVNVVIFEPFTVGRWFLQSAKTNTIWRLFRGRDNHFDSVFTLEYMREAAYCQALVYEVLYKNVFRMPDVDYAVERMLYDPDGSKMTYEQDDKGRTVAITADGRRLHMSTRNETDCILSHYRLCHFHNNTNFSRVQRFFTSHGNDAGYRVFGGIAGSNLRQSVKKANPLLSERNISCVRQLLNENIMPFSYKAAKSLDPNIYRNVEFDSWLEFIKMLKVNETDTSYQVGMKFLHQSDGVAKLCRIEKIHQDKHTCLVRVSNGTGLVCVRMDELKPYPLQKSGTRNAERNQLRGIGELLHKLEHQPKVKPAMQSPTVFYQPDPIDKTLPNSMPMLISVPAQCNMANWHAGIGQLAPQMNLRPAQLGEPVQPFFGPPGIAYGGFPAAVPLPMPPAAGQFAHAEFTPTMQPQQLVELNATAAHPHADNHCFEEAGRQQLHHQPQQFLQEGPHGMLQQDNVQYLQQGWFQQPPTHMHMQVPMQHQHQLPFSVGSYKHHSNCPAQNCVYELVPIDPNHPHFYRLPMGYEAVAYAGFNPNLHNGANYTNATFGNP